MICFRRPWNCLFLATKSVSEFSSTTAADRSSEERQTPIKPWVVLRPSNLFALLHPWAWACSSSHFLASSTSWLQFTNAFLHKDKEYPVCFRNFPSTDILGFPFFGAASDVTTTVVAKLFLMCSWGIGSIYLLYLFVQVLSIRRIPGILLQSVDIDCDGTIWILRKLNETNLPKLCVLVAKDIFVALHIWIRNDEIDWFARTIIFVCNCY